MRELSSYVSEKISESQKSQNDLVLLCGDFNLSRSAMGEVTSKRLIKINTEFEKLIEDLNMEYPIFMEIISQNYKNNVIDLLHLENPGVDPQMLCTLGDTYIN